MTAIGLRMADLFSGPAVAARPRQIVAVYSYCDLDGVICAEKVRIVPKAFRWRVPAPNSKDGHRWGLHGMTVGRYRCRLRRGGLARHGPRSRHLAGADGERPQLNPETAAQTRLER